MCSGLAFGHMPIFGSYARSRSVFVVRARFIGVQNVIYFQLILLLIKVRNICVNEYVLHKIFQV